MKAVLARRAGSPERRLRRTRVRAVRRSGRCGVPSVTPVIAALVLACGGPADREAAGERADRAGASGGDRPLVLGYAAELQTLNSNPRANS